MALGKSLAFWVNNNSGLSILAPLPQLQHPEGGRGSLGPVGHTHGEPSSQALGSQEGSRVAAAQAMLNGPRVGQGAAGRNSEMMQASLRAFGPRPADGPGPQEFGDRESVPSFLTPWPGFPSSPDPHAASPRAAAGNRSGRRGLPRGLGMGRG